MEQPDDDAVRWQRDAGSEVLFVTFGGIAGGLGVAPFEFAAITAGLGVDTIFVRDVRQAWYQRGLPGYGSDVAEVARSLGALVGQHPYRRVVMLGNSMGGFAALLFGALLGADEVHAFSPQTFVSAALRRRHGDGRWPEQVEAMHAATESGRRVEDLLGVLAAGDLRHGPLHVHFSTASALDGLHARRLKGLPGVRLHAYAGGGHKLVGDLKADGRLGALLRRSARAGAEDPDR